jgi:hypothetical protein
LAFVVVVTYRKVGHIFFFEKGPTGRAQNVPVFAVARLVLNMHVIWVFHVGISEQMIEHLDNL